MFKNDAASNDRQVEQQREELKRIEENYRRNKQKPLKVEKESFPSLPAGPPPKSAQTQKRKPIMGDSDEEESKGPAQMYDPFSGKKGAPLANPIGSQSQFATTVISGPPGGKKGKRKGKGGGGAAQG